MGRVGFDYLKEIKILATYWRIWRSCSVHTRRSLFRTHPEERHKSRGDFVGQQVRTTRTMAASTEAARQCYRLHKTSVALACRPCTRQTSLVIRRFCCLVRRQNSQFTRLVDLCTESYDKKKELLLKHPATVTLLLSCGEASDLP